VDLNNNLQQQQQPGCLVQLTKTNIEALTV
jgi:hypothetical protein